MRKGTHKTALRMNQIHDLRFKGRKSLEEIGNKLEVSRQRIEQILQQIGGTGGRDFLNRYEDTLKNNDWLRDHDHLTTDEIAALLNTSATTVYKYRSRIPYTPKGGHVRTQHIWVNKIAAIIHERGFSAEVMPRKSPYEILVGNFTRVLVSVTTTLWRGSEKNKTDYARFSVRRRKYDGEIAVCVVAETPTYFIIPTNEIKFTTSRSMLMIRWPDMRGYEQYKDNWDLLKSVV